MLFAIQQTALQQRINLYAGIQQTVSNYGKTVPDNPVKLAQAEASLSALDRRSARLERALELVGKKGYDQALFSALGPISNTHRFSPSQRRAYTTNEKTGWGTYTLRPSLAQMVFEQRPDELVFSINDNRVVLSGFEAELLVYLSGEAEILARGAESHHYRNPLIQVRASDNRVRTSARSAD